MAGIQKSMPDSLGFRRGTPKIASDSRYPSLAGRGSGPFRHTSPHRSPDWDMARFKIIEHPPALTGSCGSIYRIFTWHVLCFAIAASSRDLGP